jgi:hypothetical protein
MICFDFHGILSLVAEATEPLQRAMEREFSAFPAHVWDGHKSPDIVLKPVRPGRFSADLFESRKNIERSFVAVDGNSRLIVHLFQNVPDIVLELGHPITLHYFPERARPARIISVLDTAFQLALGRKNGLLLKGGVVCQGSRCLVLTGPSGAGKTSILVELLARGWDYLSDNTPILHDGKLHLFRERVVFNLYHAERDPQLFPQELPGVRSLRFKGMRKLLRGIAASRLPYSVASSQKLKRVFDPYIRSHPNEIAPGSRIVQSAVPTHWVVLTPGKEYSLVRIAGTDLVDRLAGIQALAYPSFEETRNQFAAYGAKIPFEWRDLFQANLSGSAFEATVAWQRPRAEVMAQVMAMVETLS